MRTAAILPVKSFARAKRRLHAGVADPLRDELARAMVGDVLIALSETASIERTILVTREDSLAATARPLGALVVRDTAEESQSAAVTLGVESAIAEGFERVLCIPGDCPALDPAEIDSLLDAADDRTRADDDGSDGDGGRAGVIGGGRGQPGVVIVPDRHGAGTNGLLLSPPDAIAPSFGPGSRARHEALARAAGAACHMERPSSLLLDIDTGEDLAVLRERLAGERVHAPRTRSVLGLVERSWQSSRPAA